MIDYKLVSDIDYSWNPETREFDVPAVEWDDSWYGTYWVRYESEEARDEALRLNEEHNNLPEVRAQIEADRHAGDVWRAEQEVNYFLEMHEYHVGWETVAFEHVLKCCAYGDRRPFIVEVVAKLVTDFNKKIMKTHVSPSVATFTLGEVFK